MVAAAPKPAFDTNLYIRALRNAEARERLSRLAETHAPRCHLLAIVAMGVLAGARDPADSRRIRKELVRPFERRRRILTPSTVSVLRAGDVLAAMRRRGTLPAGSLFGAFLNDVLIATTCLENGVVLLTHNTRDFDRISRELAGLRYASA